MTHQTVELLGQWFHLAHFLVVCRNKFVAQNEGRLNQQNG